MTGNHHYGSTTNKGISCLLDHPLINGERSKKSVFNHPLNMRIKKDATGHLAAPLVFNTGMGQKMLLRTLT